VDEAVRGTLADEETRARAVAARRLPALGRGAPADAARRLGGYLMRRGFPADVVRRVVRASCGVTITEE
jgi:SOS response regulatory protein OraA/RecX